MCGVPVEFIRNQRKKKKTLKLRRGNIPLVHYSPVRDYGFSHRACTSFLWLQPSKTTCKILNNKTEILSLVNVNSKTMMSWDGADWKKDAFFNGNILHLKVLKPFFNHVKRVLH